VKKAFLSEVFMKSIQRSPKPLKQQEPKVDLTLASNESVSELTTEHQAESIPVSDEPPKVIPQPTANRKKKKIDSPLPSKLQETFEPHSEEPELLPEKCQHIKFLDCNKPVSRIIFECWHCQQGIISEFSGEPVIGEYNGRPSVIQVQIKCPNCERTAIRLNTGEVLSTTAIPSPWRQ
jgi:hypothetical protein